MSSEQHQLFPLISEELKAAAEAEIVARQKESDFDIREYPVEVIVGKFVDKLEDDKAELFIPDYQRELIWKEHQQVRFIESVLLNLPVPYLYVADVTSGENEGRLEIVDGSQRIRTLVRFVQNELKLCDLELLPSLNGFRFEDLPLPRQLRFRRKTLRMIELVEVDEEARRQLFDRLNSGGTKLEPMEQRFGSRDGAFMNYIRRVAGDERFRLLCPISQARVKHRDYEEMVLRFFAYLERYRSFNKRVDRFLDDFLDDKNANGFNEAEYSQKFSGMLDFVERYFPFSFRKDAGNSSVPRIRFEAISVGVALAQAIAPELRPADMKWLTTKKFQSLTRSDASNSRPRVIDRIHFVRDSLLGKPVEYAGEEDSAESAEWDDEI